MSGGPKESQPSGGQPSGGQRTSGLFRRIYLALVLSVIAATVTGAAGTWLLANRQTDRWIGHTLEVLTEEHDAWVQAVPNPLALAALAEQLEHRDDTVVAVYDAEGNRLIGDGPDHVGRHHGKNPNRLRHGKPIVRRGDGRRGPIVLFPLTDPERGELLAIVHVRSEPGRVGPIFVMGLLTFGFLGAGAWMLSRTLTRRLARLERSAERIASGELGHRIPLDHDEPVDEIDEVGLAFNHMAGEVQRLVEGQRTLLANVSHELRTPIARVKVLLEILQERVEAMGPPAGPTAAHLVRLRDGLGELGRDTVELEGLVADLLTSGRLELREGRARVLVEPVDVPDLLRRVAARFGASVELDDDQATLQGDAMLLDRLLSNLLANGRRAAPDGELMVRLSSDPDELELEVIDDGPGVPEAKRELVFEPFARLDAARSRDHGGAGLGLYLCRQISAAHGGTVEVTDRLDGRRGARFVVRLPRRLPSQPSGDG